MDLETTFYIVGIISMGLVILLILSIVVILFIIKKKITETFNKVENRMEIVKDVVTHPKETAQVMGAALAHTVVKGASSLMNERRKKKRKR